MDLSAPHRARLRRSIDWVVITLTFAVIALALINLDSAGKGGWTGRVATQLRWVGLGTIVMFVVTAIDYRAIYRAAYAAYAVGVGLLALVPLYGIKVNNDAVDGRTRLREGDVVEIGDYHLAITEDVEDCFHVGMSGAGGATGGIRKDGHRV